MSFDDVDKFNVIENVKFKNDNQLLTTLRLWQLFLRVSKISES